MKAFKHSIFAVILLLLLCIPAEVEAKTTKKKADYTFKTITQSFSGTYVTGKYSFKLPKVKGSSKVVKKINRSLKAVYKESFTNRDRLRGYAESAGSSFYGAQFWDTTTCKVTYNKKGIVCFCFQNDWFAGGVHNAYHYGASYSLKTGKKLILTDVMKGSKKSIRNKIVKAYVKKLGYTRDEDTIRKSLSYTAFKDFHFWLKNGKVLVNNGSYAPGGGNGELIVKLKGNY